MKGNILVLHHLLLLVCLIAITITKTDAKIVHHKWVVKYEYKSPGCFKKLSITINGRIPGPTIVAQQGDTVIVEVTNKLETENLAIHWHGIRQIGPPWSDGTEGVTQCPVLPGDTFTYRFVVDRPGSYLYYAHYGMQRSAGLYGKIWVTFSDNVSEPFDYDYDQSIILNDWYHKSTYEQTVGMSSVPFVWVGEPQSLLIQGKGRFNCSASPSTSDPSICSATNPECSPYSVTVIPGKTYRLRVSSLTSLLALSFQIEGHNMTVVETDGRYVEPFVVQNLFIFSGETFSVLIKMNRDPSRNYWIMTNVASCNPTTLPGLAILNYYPNHPQRTPPSTPPGAWAFHCHIESHFYMGMGTVSEEDIEKVGNFPSSIMGCSDTREYRNPSLVESSGNFNGSHDEALVLKNKSQEIEPYLNGRCIYLVGMMGSGKTTVGKILSQVLNYSFCDSDSLIEEDAGGMSVSNIFKLYGEGYLREKETEILRRLSIMDRLIVSPGGGAVTRPINWKHIRRGISVWLDVPLEALAQRIAAVGTHSRPLLHNESGDPYTKVYNRLSTLLEERGEAYSNANARVSLENIAAKRGLRDVSFISPTAVAIEALEQIQAYLEERDGML